MDTSNLVVKRILSILLITLAVFFGLKVKAQQDPIYNQYMFNPLVINPAYAGSRDQMSVVILNRSQWVGFGGGAPNTQTVSFHTPLIQGKVGLGAVVTRDVIGPVSRTGVSGAYAYRLKLRTGKLAFALRTGIYNYVFDWNKIDYKDSEPLVSESKTAGWVPNFDFGVRYSTKKLYAGLTLLNLNNPDLNFLKSDTSSFASALSRHINITAGYALELKKDWVLKPSTMIRYEKGPSSNTVGNGGAALNGIIVADINVSVLYKNMIWAGISVRSSKALIAVLEYNISKQLRLGYSYELTLSKLRTTNSGTHEIFIGVDFGRKQKPRLMSPRVYF
jgi:type IX secretion system PorP/SprF family membrane protein